MNFLLRLAAWITDHPKSAFALVFLAGGLLGVLAGRRLCETPSLKAEESKSGAAFGREDLTRKTEEGPWSADTWYFGSPAGTDTTPVQSGHKTSDHDTSVAPAVPTQGFFPPQAATIAFRHEEHGPTASETHASSESASSSTQTLKLSQEAGSAPQWALGASLEGAFGARILRLSVRRKILGPIWLEASAVPASMAVGFGAALEF